MNQEERQLLQGLFDRLRDSGNQPRDPEVERFIADQMRAQPGSAYYMAQAVVVQEEALKANQQQIADLEDRVRQIEAAGQPRSQGNFLAGRTGGMFGRGSSPDPGRPASAVPPTTGPWGRTSTAQPVSQQPYGQQGQGQPPMQAQQPAAGGGFGGGGFLKGALATAAGVAGGALVYDQMKGMFGGGSGAAHASSAGSRDADVQGQVDRALDEAQDEEFAENAAADQDQDTDMDSGGDIET